MMEVPVPQNICEAHLRLQCSVTPCHHCPLPYQWEISYDVAGQQVWWSIPEELNIEIETVFCQPRANSHSFQVTVNNKVCSVQLVFDSLKATITVDNCVYTNIVRRLSTGSYAFDQEIVSSGGEKTIKFVTQWRWYFCADGAWKQFGSPMRIPQQYVLEAKYLHCQPVYRFDVETDNYVVDLRHGMHAMKSLKTGKCWQLRRRPLLVTSLTQPHDSPSIAISPFNSSIPANWSPIDMSQEYELVPLDPSSVEYHLVASSFYESVSQTERHISDVFRIQNVFLWNKYFSKRQQMELKRQRQPFTCDSQESLELQLFHGTRDEIAVQSIFHQNFDWRLNGSANDVVYGRGAYFAYKAQFSDRYAKNSINSQLSWMFLARVLVGRSTVGRREYVRPPPLDPARPHGDLYDSCVNELHHPAIYVIFDSDQCYPEYVISYTSLY